MKLSKYTKLIEEVEKGFMLLDEFNVIVEKEDMEIVKGYLKDKGYYEQSGSKSAKFLIIGRKESVTVDFILFSSGSKNIKVIEESWNLRKMLRGE